MDALGIPQASVVAHDWGGIIAFKLAIDWPDRVTRLALLDTLCTVWHPAGVHGYWFKAEPLPEELFARHHRAFIETIFAGGSATPLPGRPQSPWAGGGRPWASAEVVDTYRRAFADPLSHFHAISYYRYALPFHVVTPDEQARHGERFESLSESDVAAMWLHEGGLEQHPRYADYLDYAPEDRHKRFARPVLWAFATGSRSRAAGVPRGNRAAGVPRGNPFLDQFSRYFPDLRGHSVAGGHFFPEENPEDTNALLGQFLRGSP